MAVLQMQRISICALRKDRKAILEKLQTMGVMEIDHVLEDDDESFRRINTANVRMSFEKAATAADQALDLLQQYAPVKQTLLSSLEGKDLIQQEEYQEVIRKKDDLLKTAKRIQALDKERVEHKANILKIENSIEGLTPWLALELPVTFEGTEHTVMLPGVMSGQQTLETIYQMLAEHSPELEVDIHMVSVDQDTTYLVVFCLRKDAQVTEESLRSIGFARPSQIIDKIPANAKAELEKEIDVLKSKIANLEEEVCDLDKYRESLQIVADYYRVRAEKYDVLGQLPQSERTFLISGYVPARDVGDLQNALIGKYPCVVDVEEIKEEEDAPVLLKNNAFSAGTEGVLEAFGLPGKGEVDPTVIMSVFYVFLFGLMLSDAAYGAIVATACGVLLLKYPRMGKGMKQSFQLFFWCGLSTLFWGVMFGGYFGDVINVVSKTFFGQEVGIPAVWFVPLDEPMKLLIYSMLFGVIHLFMGLGIKGYMCLRDKRYMDFFCDVILWMMLLCGLLIMLIPSEMFTSIAQMTIVFPAIVITLGKWLAILGAVGIVLMSGRDKKNVGLRIALGAYDLYNVSGWLSDVLSYSRLLALGLATGVIASVINQMGSMAGKSVFGVIVFILAFVFGHTFNLAINILGAYVHTNRLQFVEFFGKFYEGGGRPFHPFQENTKYADIEEETKI